MCVRWKCCKRAFASRARLSVGEREKEELFWKTMASSSCLLARSERKPTALIKVDQKTRKRHFYLGLLRFFAVRTFVVCLWRASLLSRWSNKYLRSPEKLDDLKKGLAVLVALRTRNNALSEQNGEFSSRTRATSKVWTWPPCKEMTSG